VVSGISQKAEIVGYYDDDDGVFHGFLGTPMQVGDFNLDGDVNELDIDLLAAAIRAGDEPMLFDVNASGGVDSADFAAMLQDVLRTLPGDANLDYVVDGSDFNVWNDHRFSSGTGWASGDFNGDGQTLADDFELWNSNRFSLQPDKLLVPEPTSALLLSLGMMLWLHRAVQNFRRFVFA
jgi:hypothetical protein